MSDKYVKDVSLSYEQNKSIDMLDAKEHHSIYGLEHEDEGKDEQKGREHLLDLFLEASHIWMIVRKF